MTHHEKIQCILILMEGNQSIYCDVLIEALASLPERISAQLIDQYQTPKILYAIETAQMAIMTREKKE